MLTVRRVDNVNLWSRFLDSVRPPTFLQSWSWGELHAMSHDLVGRFGVFRDDELQAVAQVLRIKARRGTFFLIPHGPILCDNVDLYEVMIALVDHFTPLAKADRANCLRVCSLTSHVSRQLFHRLGFRDASTHLHPELSWILPLTKNEDELLMGMRKTTRQAIRKAEQSGVTVEISSNLSALEEFWKVYQKTVARQQFTPFSQDCLRHEIEVLVAREEIIIGLARLEDRVISGAIVALTPWSAFYHHGASDPVTYRIPAAHALQWTIIREVKKRGCMTYNFWGVSPEERTRHPWAGLSMFKRGFGGHEEAYLHAQDLVLNWRYWPMAALESIRRRQRRL